MSAEIRIGTSGWHYAHWRGNFYPAKLSTARMLEHYAGNFDTVELNNTFYRLPSEKGLEGWREGTPRDFLFAVKGSRYLTHMKKLKDPEPGLARFFERVELLGRKLGPILFQLPPNWPVDAGRLTQFLRALPRRRRYAFEFRNESWNTIEVDRLLQRHNAAVCAFHLAGYESPVKVTADFAYIRLHGPGGKYQGSYTDRALEGWAERIAKWRTELRTVFVYFDNDEAGYAARDALRLKELVSR